MSSFDQMDEAIHEAHITIRRADKVLAVTAQHLRHRLRASSIPGHVLADLKRELRDFDLRTARWKDD